MFVESNVLQARQACVKVRTCPIRLSAMPTEFDLPPNASNAPVPTPWRLFLIFTRIGLSSFGGGISGWLMREFVQDRHWIDEDAFLNGLALCQALPGVNVKNMAIWIGYRLLGRAGACAALAGIILPPAVLIVLLGVLFNALSVHPLVRVGLAGAAAAATGLSLSMGLTTAQRLPRRWVPIGLAAATFIAVGVMRLPLLWVLLIAGGLGIAYEYHRLSGDQA